MVDLPRVPQAASEGITMVRYHLLLMSSVFHIDLINVAFVMSGAHLVRYLRDRQDAALRAARLESQLADARLHSLQAQLQPHFLFNSLHTIGQLVRTQRPADAMLVVERLGDLLRRSLSAESRPAIPLQQELDNVRAYLDIERVRFSDRLRVSFQIEPALLGMLVPALLLQPIVENAIRHGIARASSAGELIISARREGDRACFEVLDDGPGFSASASTSQGIGLRNTRDRLSALFGEHATLTTYSSPAGGARVTISIPVGARA